MAPTNKKKKAKAMGAPLAEGADKATTTNGLSAIAAEFVPTGGAAVADSLPAGACSFGLGEGDLGGAALAESWWPGLGEAAPWPGEGGDGSDVASSQELYLWDYSDLAWQMDASFCQAIGPVAEQEPLGQANLRNFKTAPCWHFARGRCAMGERCRFAHGASDMRKPGSGQLHKGELQDPSEDILTLCGAWGALTTRKPGVVAAYQPLTRSYLLSWRLLAILEPLPWEPGELTSTAAWLPEDEP